VKARLARELRVKGDGEDGARARGDDVTVDLADRLDGGSVVRDPGGADEDGVHRLAEAVERDVGFEAPDLAAEGVALGTYVEDAEVLAVEQDKARTGREDRQSSHGCVAKRLL